jgi:hypothetical protein
METAFETGGHMRLIGATTLAIACALGLAAQAQESTTKTETKVKTDDAKMVTFSGCVKPGAEAKAYILEKAVPVRRTTTEETTGTSGVVTTTTTTYALVPGESVELTGDIGHKVEVTGMMVGGETKETKTTKETASGTRTEETVKRDGALPQFRVISVKHLPETCS